MESQTDNLPNASTSAGYTLGLDGIDKSFFGVRVLKGVSFEVAAGKTLGLVGENGAGKSTLMNILGGNLKPEAGTMQLSGQSYQPTEPRDAERAGIAFVHQELNLFGNLSIAENLFINAFPRRMGFLDRRTMEKKSREALALTGLSVSPHTIVDRLSAGERQLVEIAKALSRNAKLIIFDEPTTSLAAKEKEHLFEILSRLRTRGITMIYISHALDDIKKLADHIVVLRDGEVVGSDSADDLSTNQMISMMVGRDIEHLFPPRTHSPDTQVALEVIGVSKRGVVRDINFDVRKGEVLGISGLMGSGRTELARILFGLDPMDSGEIKLNRAPVHNLTPRERVSRGLAFLTEDRRAEGLMMGASIADNMTLTCAENFTSGRLGWLKRTELDQGVREYRDSVHLTPTALDEQAVKTLSGGNQQKVVLAKWLLNKPSVIILDEPTRGIDVGAKFEVYSLINELTAKGEAVIVISSELEELIGICDRILVMKLGEIAETFERESFDRELILKAALQ
jgi:ribose transport system ATP-binding protein